MLILIGGLLIPGGQTLLAGPAAAIGAILIVWTILRTLPVVHWVIIYVPILFFWLSLHRGYVAPENAYGEEKFIGFVTLTLFSAFAACLINEREGGFAPFARVWIVASLWLTASSLATGTGLRTAAFGANPIWVSRALAVGLLFTVWLYWTRQLRARWALIVGVILIVGLFSSGSRGPLIGAVIGIAVLIIASNAKKSRKFLMVVGSAVAAFGLLRLPFFQESRIIALATGEIADDTTRRSMWEESLIVLQENPLGVGYGNWNLAVSGLNYFNYPHNLFLEVFVEQGIIIGSGLILIVAGVLIAILRRSRKSTAALGIAAWLVTEIVNVSVSGDLNARTFFFVLVLAALTATWPPTQSDSKAKLSTPATASHHLQADLPS